MDEYESLNLLVKMMKKKIENAEVILTELKRITNTEHVIACHMENLLDDLHFYMESMLNFMEEPPSYLLRPISQ